VASITPEPRSSAFLPIKSLIALLSALGVLLVIAVMSYRSLRERSETANAMREATAVRKQLFSAMIGVLDAETGERGFLVSGEERFLEPYTRALSDAPVAMRTLHTMLAGDPVMLETLERVDASMQIKFRELADSIDKRRHGEAVTASSTDRSKRAMEEIRADIGQMLETVDFRRAERTREWEDSARWSSYVTMGGGAVLLGMLLLLGLFASRDFRAVTADGWIRRVQLSLGVHMQGDPRLDVLGDNVLRVLAANLDAHIGAMYLVDHGELQRVGGLALPPGTSGDRLAAGEGLHGQAIKDQRVVHVRDLPVGYFPVTSATGAAKARELVVVPTTVDGATLGVLELGFLHELDATQRLALERAADAVAVAVRSARDRSRLEELLHETQRQAEELQAQQEELRVTNEELEQQSRSLQLSQAQLENQQAELEQINTQLEEQTQSLERQRDELARAGSELQRANEYKSQFLANMSHELRTPLNSTLILAKLLADNREKNLTDEQVNFANTIYSAGNDLLTLINDILDLSKIEAGMLDVRPEPVQLARLADDLRNTFQPIASDKKLDLSIVVERGAPVVIQSDPTRLNQILKNLLSNSLKFTDQGGVTLTISGAGDRVRFAVKDTGIGIAPEQHDLVFDAFKQADGASTRKHGGTGLGLSISRDLARLLGGDLTLDSAPGRGSTFTLELPMRPTLSAPPPPAARPVPATPAAQPKAAPIPDDRERVKGGTRSLLIVEDDLAFAKVLADLAHELDYLVIAADSGDDALALARLHAPSAIIMDVGLPDRSGLAVLDALKRDPRTRHIPVHVVSVDDYTRTALEMGAVGYAIKPVEREQLVQAIQQLEAKFPQRMRRILIVEDDALLRDSTARLLAGDNVETVVAGTTAEALERLRATTFDCMVLDLTLPDRSGLELLEEMARDDAHAFPPVIVYTGRKLTNDQVRELEKFSRSIIIKGAKSPERLVDEVTLFLHQVEADLPLERQHMLRDVRDREAVFEGRRILVVEDDIRNVFALSSVLQPKGATVEVARNGKEALAALEKSPEVDLVLMDIMMPEMDGLEATRRLRAQPRFAKLPIIALTAKAMIDDRQKCIEAGANDYIAKPLDVDKLLSLARVWIRK
jgi:CheY-like chemotaxis protein/CHASE3 domain sensor protein